MADTKISALPSATTPLAGTEVLPIVQGGATDKVSIANLTAGRSVTMSELGVGIATPSDKVHVFGASVTGLLVQDAGTAYRVVAANGINFIQSGLALAGDSKAPLVFTSMYGVTELLRVETNGDLGIPNGNLVISTANKSISFSGNGGVLWRCGAGTPEGVVTAPVGSLFTRTDGGLLSTLYVKESGTGNTGWVGK